MWDLFRRITLRYIKFARAIQVPYEVGFILLVSSKGHPRYTLTNIRKKPYIHSSIAAICTLLHVSAWGCPVKYSVKSSPPGVVRIRAACLGHQLPANCPLLNLCKLTPVKDQIKPVMKKGPTDLGRSTEPNPDKPYKRVAGANKRSKSTTKQAKPKGTSPRYIRSAITLNLTAEDPRKAHYKSKASLQHKPEP